MAKYIRDIIITILVALLIFILLQTTIGSFRVYGTSMMPGIKDGEYIMVSKITYIFQPPQRGDIIVFNSPRNPGSDLIKRVIGIPGDTVEIKDNRVFINNNPIAEPYILEKPSYHYPSQQITPGQYFVLGDNRNNSADSHTGWLLPEENIIGKALFSYWPPPNWAIIKHYPILATQ
jgi:signal peptidase I